MRGDVAIHRSRFEHDGATPNTARIADQPIPYGGDITARLFVGVPSVHPNVKVARNLTSQSVSHGRLRYAVVRLNVAALEFLDR